ncbi:hypothetical protein PC128_g22908 [Phytophthora cactorum]|nr:hypothetical protein PC128_g22908 [Phytophthora cactorum]
MSFTERGSRAAGGSQQRRRCRGGLKCAVLKGNGQIVRVLYRKYTPGCTALGDARLAQVEDLYQYCDPESRELERRTCGSVESGRDTTSMGRSKTLVREAAEERV